MHEVRHAILLAEQASLLHQLQDQPRDWLAPSERARLGRIASGSRQSEYLAGRFALRQLLSLVCPATSWQDWELASPENASPVVWNVPAAYAHRDFHLSLSHSAGLIAVAVGDTVVGVDLEVQRKARPVCALIEMIATEEEAVRLQTLARGLQQREFHRLWTLKEAYFKRLGTGIDLAEIRVVATSAVHDDRGAADNAAIWEGSYEAWPYTLSFCGVMHSLPTVFCSAGMTRPTHAGWCGVSRPSPSLS